MPLAVIQMVSQSDVLANLAQARRLLEQAAERGAQLAVLPENFAAMGRREAGAGGAPRLAGCSPPPSRWSTSSRPTPACAWSTV